jgi:polar amino acid transport system substrate-binding protein
MKGHMTRRRWLIYGVLLFQLEVGHHAWAAPLEILTDDNPPWSYMENDQVSGLCTDLVKEIQSRVGSHDEIQLIPWQRAYNLALTRPNVALYLTARTDQRDKLFQWVGPLSYATPAFYSLSSSTLSFKNLDEVKAASRIVVVRGWFTEQVLAKLGFTNVEAVESPERMIQLLISGRAPLMFAVSESLNSQMARLGVPKSSVKPVFSTGQRNMNYVAFSLGTPAEVVAHWQFALDGMKQDGTYAAIFKKWKVKVSDDVPMADRP